MTIQSPVLVNAEPDQVKSLDSFIQEARKGSVHMAAMEAQRLLPYFKHYAAQTRQDLKQLGSRHLKRAVTPNKLQRLFNTVASRTKNTVLSKLMIVPETLLSHPLFANDKQFKYQDKYGDNTFTFGFVQVFDEKAGKEKSSVSVPVLALDDKMLTSAAPSQYMLHLFQRMASAGNHDMLHHYSNTALNSNIATTDRPQRANMVENWAMRHFTTTADTDPNSYESWLMLAHMRNLRQLEKGKEGLELRNTCNRFFTELEKMGKTMSKTHSPEEAHKAVNYFGTLFCFSMMRFMPLNHPLLDHAIERLRQADPDKQAIIARKDDILKNSAENALIQEAVGNYAARGVDISGKNGDYASLKKLELAAIAPWVARLLSPPPPGSQLDQMQKRINRVNADMLDAVLQNVETDGTFIVKTPEGTIIERHLKGGKLDRENGPAFTATSSNGRQIKGYYHNGEKVREESKGPDGYKEEHFQDNQLRYSKEISNDGSITERTYGSDGGHHEKITLKSGSVHQEWIQDKKRHRVDGPAHTINERDGSSLEEWFQEGQLHRVGGPASTKINADGSKHEAWYENGTFLRRVETAPDGTKKTTTAEQENDDMAAMFEDLLVQAEVKPAAKPPKL